MRSLIFLCILFFLAPFSARAQDSIAVAGKDGDAWALRCAQDKKGEPEGCEIFQRLVDSPTGRRVAEFAVGFPKGKESGRGVAILPLGILLEPGVTMQIDDGQQFFFKIRYCSAEGCFAYVDLNEDVLERLKNGKNLVFTLTLKDGQIAPLTMTLNGFTASFEKLN